MKIISFGAQERERGIIMRCKEGLNYCFIKCCNREDPLFMHLSEFVGPDSTPVPIDDEKSHDSSTENYGNDAGYTLFSPSVSSLIHHEGHPKE